ncbi:MAG: iron(III) transport system substrate-binding protein [Cellvibrionaceae bacterium]|jgi:iron(III) transport system substrate-binding protein
MFKIMSKKVNKAFVVASSLLVAVSLSLPVLAAEEVNIYSARKEALIKPILDRFEAETNIKVNLITAKAGALLTRLSAEGKASPADVFITVDAGNLQRAKEAGVLQVVESDVLNKKIPATMRDEEGYWFGLSMRARPIFYAKDRVDPAKLSTYEALGDDQWKGRVCIRSSSNIYNQSLIASMMVANGSENTEAWAKKLVANFAKPPAGGDTDQLKAVNAGLCDVAIANTYYYGRLANSEKASDNEIAQKLAIFWPNQSNRGTHVNVSGAGVTAHSKNKDNAIQLIEFLTTDEAQAWYSKVNNEYPVVDRTKISETLKAWGTFKQDEIPLNLLGENNRAALELMDRAGWK